jgi:hypothetical protein
VPPLVAALAIWGSDLLAEAAVAVVLDAVAPDEVAPAAVLARTGLELPAGFVGDATPAGFEDPVRSAVAEGVGLAGRAALELRAAVVAGRLDALGCARVADGDVGAAAAVGGVGVGAPVDGLGSGGHTDAYDGLGGRRVASPPSIQAQPSPGVVPLTV